MESIKPIVPFKKKPRIARRFLGKTEGFSDKQDRNFNKKMLKAYLKGATMFSFGLHPENRQPLMFEVLQEIYKPKVMA